MLSILLSPIFYVLSGNKQCWNLNPIQSSDLAGSFTGFRLQYTTEQLDSLCIGVTKLSGKRGQVSSIPITPDYNRMLTCSWLIEGSPGKQIEIQVTNIFTSKDCLQDFVSFIDGPSVADREIARFQLFISRKRVNIVF